MRDLTADIAVLPFIAIVAAVTFCVTLPLLWVAALWAVCFALVAAVVIGVPLLSLSVSLLRLRSHIGFVVTGVVGGAASLVLHLPSNLAELFLPLVIGAASGSIYWRLTSGPVPRHLALHGATTVIVAFVIGTLPMRSIDRLQIEIPRQVHATWRAGTAVSVAGVREAIVTADDLPCEYSIFQEGLMGALERSGSHRTLVGVRVRYDFYFQRAIILRTVGGTSLDRQVVKAAECRPRTKQ